MNPVWTQGRRVIAVFALLLPAARARAQEPPAAPAAAQVAPSASATPNVVAVRLVSEDGKALEKVPGHLAVQAGTPLDERQVAEALRTLYRTGDYADLKAVAV